MQYRTLVQSDNLCTRCTINNKPVSNNTKAPGHIYRRRKNGEIMQNQNIKLKS
jgi:hypothetical protein